MFHVEQTEEDMSEVYAQIVEDERKYLIEVERVNKRICKAILNQLGVSYLRDIMAVAKENEVEDRKYEIVREPSGNYQEEYGFDCFEGYWVEQWSVGDSGDSFNGYICIQLKPGKWLKMFYSC